jgi:hypothetical protein
MIVQCFRGLREVCVVRQPVSHRRRSDHHEGAKIKKNGG